MRRRHLVHVVSLILLALSGVLGLTFLVALAYGDGDAGAFAVSGAVLVPGMVVGPPGMEGAEPVPYDVVTFDEEGNTQLYESRPGKARSGSG